MKRALAVLILSAVIIGSAFSIAYPPFDRKEVNSLDSLIMRPYNKTLDDIATGLEVAALLSPAILLSEDSDQYVTIGTMFIETLALSWGTKEILKTAVDRPRPYMYFEGYPQNKVNDGDWDDSFPSGHSAMAFAGASFTSYVFARFNPDSKWKIPVIVSSYAVATATAALRIASGNHFLTDVLAGALIGTLYGVGIPALHTLLAKNDASLSVSPFGLVFSRSF